MCVLDLCVCEREKESVCVRVCFNACQNLQPTYFPVLLQVMSKSAHDCLTGA